MSGIFSRLSRAFSSRPHENTVDQDWAPAPEASGSRSLDAQQHPSPETAVIDQLIAAVAKVAQTRQRLVGTESEQHQQASALEEQVVGLVARIQQRQAAGLEVRDEQAVGAELLQHASALINSGE